MYMSVAEAAEKFTISKRRVQLLCEQGRLAGAKLDNGSWLIPIEAKKPADARKKQECSGKNEKDLSLDQVCRIFSISRATAKNWIKLGKLIPNEDGKTFKKTYIKRVVSNIESGKDDRLKKRRNKNGLSGKILYKDYIENENNQKIIRDILEKCNSLSSNELRVIIAFFAFQLYCQSRGLCLSNDDFFKFDSSIGDDLFKILVFDLLNGIDLNNFNYSNIKFIFKQKVRFVPSDDTLGFIYISLSDLGDRKQTGTYYTPINTVQKLIDDLELEGLSFEDETFFDPCCGTGNFLIGLSLRGANIEGLYGQDIDEISVLITRINMFLLNDKWSRSQLYTHFVCGSTLDKTSNRTFSVVLGNPPWGYNFSSEEIAYFLKNYQSARSAGLESYDLFIERGIEMLENDGYLAYVLPKAILSVAAHVQARELILNSTSFRFVSYLGNVFSGVQCPTVVLGLKKDGLRTTEKCRVLYENEKFVIAQNRNFNSSIFPFNMTDIQFDCLEAIENVENAKYLSSNAEFALGIVTGNNKKYLKTTKRAGYEVILKGSDILRYGTKDTRNYIHFEPKSFQQVAPTKLYRAKEKLLYRFISEVPVFTYDDKGTLSLNSCNILIPKMEGMSIKFVLAILNSSVAAYYLKEKFDSVKLLRSHIESLPIPIVSLDIEERIVDIVDRLLTAQEKTASLYEELDELIFSIYSLSKEQKNVIKTTLSSKMKFLK